MSEFHSESVPGTSTSLNRCDPRGREISTGESGDFHQVFMTERSNGSSKAPRRLFSSLKFTFRTRSADFRIQWNRVTPHRARQGLAHHHPGNIRQSQDASRRAGLSLRQDGQLHVTRRHRRTVKHYSTKPLIPGMPKRLSADPIRRPTGHFTRPLVSPASDSRFNNPDLVQTVLENPGIPGECRAPANTRDRTH